MDIFNNNNDNGNNNSRGTGMKNCNLSPITNWKVVRVPRLRTRVRSYVLPYVLRVILSTISLPLYSLSRVYESARETQVFSRSRAKQRKGEEN